MVTSSPYSKVTADTLKEKPTHPIHPGHPQPNDKLVMSEEHRSILERIEELLNTGKGKQLDELGREVPDPRPMAPPIGYVKQPTMVDHIRNLVRSHMLAAAAEAADAETFDDADDFDVEDDPPDPHTPYEAVFDPPATPLPGESTNPPPSPSVAPQTAPQAQGTQPQAGETAPASPPPPPASGSGAQP